VRGHVAAGFAAFTYNVIRSRSARAHPWFETGSAAEQLRSSQGVSVTVRYRIVGRVCYTRGYFQGRGSPHSPLVELFNKLNSILVTL
jgi:hypothetical protein